MTARDRWPVIFVCLFFESSLKRVYQDKGDIEFLKQTGVIDDVHRAIMVCQDGEKSNEGKIIVKELGKLKYEMQHDRQLTYSISIFHSSSFQGDELLNHGMFQSNRK